MTASDKLLAINIFDDGPMNPKGTHTAPGTTRNLDTVKFFEEMFEKTLKDTEKAESVKLILMLERYARESVQLPQLPVDRFIARNGGMQLMKLLYSVYLKL